MEIKKASLFKRISAAMMDLMLMFIVGYLVASFVCQPIVLQTTDIREKQQEYYDALFELGYIVIAEIDSDNGEAKFNVVASFDDENSVKEAFKEKVKTDSKNYSYLPISNNELNLSNTDFDKYLTHFYTTIDAMEKYNGYKEQSKLFTRVDDDSDLKNAKFVIKDDVEEEDEKNFYIDTYGKVLYEEQYKKYDNYRIYNLENYINGMMMMCIYSGMFIATLVFYLLIPLITKNGQTLGKKLMQLGVVNIKDGLRAKKLSLIIRYMTFVIIELLLSNYLFFLPFIISTVLVVMTKKGQAGHDFTSRTAVVDLTEHSFDLDEEEDVVEAETSEVTPAEEAVTE